MKVLNKFFFIKFITKMNIISKIEKKNSTNIVFLSVMLWLNSQFYGINVCLFIWQTIFC